MKGTGFRAFRLIYTLILVALLLWGFKNYRLVYWKYRWLWFSNARVEPFSESLMNPLVIVECEMRDARLVVHLLRTYVRPELEDLLLVARFEPVSGKSVTVEMRKNVILGSVVSLEIEIPFSGPNPVLVASYRVEVYLNGNLVAVKQED